MGLYVVTDSHAVCRKRRRHSISSSEHDATPPFERRVLPNTISEWQVLSSSPNATTSTGYFVETTRRAEGGKDGKKICSSLDEELDDMLFSASFLEDAVESSNCGTEAPVHGDDSDNAGSALCEDVFGGLSQDEKHCLVSADCPGGKAVEGFEKSLGVDEGVEGLGDKQGVGEEGVKGLLGEEGLEGMEGTAAGREGRIAGEGVEEMEGELLHGFYPEDFSLFLDCSALLPQEDTSTGGGDLSTGGSPSTGDGLYKHPPEATPMEGCGTSACLAPRSPSAHLHHMPASQLPQSCSSPRAAASSSHKLPPHPPPAQPDRISYPADTFYGLPLTVQKCLEEYRGIRKLYGNTTAACFK